jgi:hypothetical protein
MDVTGHGDAIDRPRYLSLLHGIGVVCGLAALYIRGFGSPAVGFPIAITILVGLGVLFAVAGLIEGFVSPYYWRLFL